MAINKQTIISAFDDKLTLLQWLKTINKALDEAVLTGVEVRQKGNATYSFVVTFEDGTELESNEFVLAQGESINGATIRNGHLYLSLTNGDELDAGNLKPVTSFAINESQHLIVNYGDGTSQDLGAIFSGNVNIDGNFTANSIIENMNGYSFVKGTTDNVNYNFKYAGVVKTGNKVTFAIALELERIGTPTNSQIRLGSFNIPKAIGELLIPTTSTWIDFKKQYCASDYNTGIDLPCLVNKQTDGIFHVTLYEVQNLELNKRYFIRFETTFLLSDNMAGN